tara:strand:- start:1677 stop:5330 length:3654 start_codon:yes stop_codon:yes gene_type:complete
VASDTITLTLKVKQDGKGFKLVEQQSKKAAQGLNETAKGARNADRNLKGAANMSSNTTKNFSKMQQGISGGLVPAYAALAANVFALTALFGVLSRNDAIAKLEEGLEFTGRAAGRNLTLVAEKLQEITDNAISAEQAMRTTAVGISAGFSEQQMAGLAQVAKGASLALGRDMADAMDRLTRGAAKLEPEILDELGIMVRLDDAVNNYAIAHNKAVTELTQFERRQAFTNAIIEDGATKFQALSKSLEPSAYAQLSAAFSDLSKSFINGLNTFLTPLIKFLADTPIALGALAAAFGASISGQIMGGLKGMAASSVEASKSMKNMVGESLKGVSAHEKLGKAFNSVANGATRTDADLQKMMKSLNMTVNMTSKDTEKLKIAKTARNGLTKEIHLQNIAQAKNTSGNALATMQTHGLTAAAKVQAQAFRELSAAHTTAMATTTGFAKAGVMARTVTTGLAMSVRFLGGAFLTIMPAIAGVLMAFSLLSPLFKKFFSDTSQLGKALKDNEKRFEEFNEVAIQYSKTILFAKTSTEQWISTLKPLAGILTEVQTALQTSLAAARADAILALADATKEAKDAQKAYNEATESMMTGYEGLGEAVELQKAQEEVQQSGELSEKALKKLRETAVTAASKAQGAFEVMKISLKDTGVEGGIALKAIENAQNAVTTAFNTFAQSDQGEEAYGELLDTITKSASSANSAVNAFETFNETIRKAKEIVGDTESPFGVLSKELINIRDAITKVNAVGEEDGPTQEQANKILAAYGIKDGTVEKLKEVEATLTRLNERYKTLTLEEAREALLDQNTVRVGRMRVKNLEERIRLKQEEIDFAVKGSEKENELMLEKLALERQLTNEMQKQGELVTERMTRLGGTFAGQLSGISEGFFNYTTEGGEGENARTSERFAKLSELSKPLLNDMAKLSPEGEFISTAVQGALTLGEAFSMAFEDIGEGGNKMQIGLEVASAGLNVIAGMMMAQSKAQVSAIDSQIEAEKKRDGTSEKSIAKIKALEKKKEQIQRKAFERDKKLKMAAVLTSTGAAIMKEAEKGLPASLPGIAFFTALGAAQLAAIASTSYQGGGSVSNAANAPTELSIGKRENRVDLARSNNAAGELAFMRGERGTGRIENFRSAFGGYKMNRAAGGFVVGEQGPELFMPKVPGEIIPSGQSSGGTTNVNFSINAVDATGVEDLLVRQKGNIIGMIREAANEHGELFLETIDTGAYN